MKSLFSNINIKGTLVLGVFTTIICVYLIQPIIDIAKNFSGNIFTSLVDYYFFKAATVNSNALSQIGSFYIVVAFISFVIQIMFDKIKNYNIDIQYINKFNEQTKQAKETNEISLIDEISEIKNQILELEEEIKKIPDKQVDSIKVLKKKRIISVAGFSFYLLYLMYIIFFFVFPQYCQRCF